MGKKNYKKVYSKYKPNVDFTAYVDHYPDLKNAWSMIEAKITGKDMSKIQNTGNPNLSPEQQADYWIKRMPTDDINNLAAAKKAFGQAHAAEDNALMMGNYMGGTDVAPGGGPTRYTKYTQRDDNEEGTETETTTTETETTPEQDITNPRSHPWVDTVLKENLSFKAQDLSRFMTKPGTGVWDSGVNLGENKGLMFQRYTPEFTATYGGATPFQYLKTPYKKPKGKRWKAPPHIEGSGGKKKKAPATE